jgi:hypothetical protein
VAALADPADHPGEGVCGVPSAVDTAERSCHGHVAAPAPTLAAFWGSATAGLVGRGARTESELVAACWIRCVVRRRRAGAGWRWCRR